MSDSVPLLELRNVSRVFGGGGLFSQRPVPALKDFSLTLDGACEVTAEAADGEEALAALARPRWSGSGAACEPRAKPGP